MRVFIITISAFGLILSGCTSLKTINDKLGTLKNPNQTLGDARIKKERTKINPFVLANYSILLEGSKNLSKNNVESSEMRPYLDAGFALSDYYCESFFRDADESQRRRRFGRALTNDAGTVISTVLGLANAGQNVVTGVAAGFGFGDNIWRNYDDAFVVTPDLSNIQSLVLAAQNNFREKTTGKDAKDKDLDLPRTYGKAQSVIMRYANLCSTLGMKSLLSQSADDQRTKLQDQTRGESQPVLPVAGAAGAGGAAVPATGQAIAPIAEPRAAPQAIPG
jgi:hypothetical protein